MAFMVMRRRMGTHLKLKRYKQCFSLIKRIKSNREREKETIELGEAVEAALGRSVEENNCDLLPVS